MFNLNFSLKFNKLTGLRLRVVALIKSFYVNFQFGWTQKKTIEYQQPYLLNFTQGIIASDMPSLQEYLEKQPHLNATNL